MTPPGSNSATSASLPAPSVFTFASFGEYLAAYVEFMRAKNPAFSARALAKRLRRSPSLLTMIARGERRAQPDLVQDLAEHIGLTPVERDFAEALLNFERAKSQPARARFAAKLRLLKPSNDDLLLTLDQFELVSNWHHSVILELIRLPRFREEPEEVARYLGITVTPDMVRESITLLERLGLAARDAKGKLYKTNETIRTPEGFPSQAIRAHHKQMLMRAHQAIERQPVPVRLFSSATLPVPASKVKEIADRIVAFREQLMADLDLTANPDEVYHLNFQFFRSTTDPVFPRH